MKDWKRKRELMYIITIIIVIIVTIIITTIVLTMIGNISGLL